MITNFFIPELKNHDVQELWLQQDGATCHTARATIDLLKDTFGDHLISRFGPVNWPPRSCDLTPLDYFLWGSRKCLAYLVHNAGNILNGYATFDDGLPICAAEVEEFVDLPEPMNINFNAEIYNGTSMKTFAFSNVLHCSEIVKTYLSLSQQDVNDEVFFSPQRVENSSFWSGMKKIARHLLVK
ncbi:uncharacterized protein TNCV_3773771 [Trichonephila clavipes]|nr:uncharacterized protein TNCV_3773771 [Trichonephila clavipes]